MKILNTRAWDDFEKTAISGVVRDVTFLEPGTDGKMEDLVNQADVLFGFPSIPIEAIAKSPTLRLLHVPSTGVDKYVTPEMRASRIILTNSRGVQAKPVSEHAVMLMLALSYKLPQLQRNQATRSWENVGVERLEGQTAGLLGLGAIGEEIARKCKAFDMRVIGTRRDASVVPPNVDEVFDPKDTNEVLRQSDFVLCSLPLTLETERFMDYGRFCAMKSTAYFVNVGRGPVVVEEDLIRALREGRFKGAGLDVFETEPLPKESPLWGMENVIVTPHAAGNAKANRQKVLAILVENLRRMQAGLPLVNVVDMTLGY
ncbi:MAG: D-2-hydroxyacid dehydrogenase [Bacillota bacterium]